VGAGVGAVVGAAVGALVGAAVGAAVGDAVGVAVGAAVGAAVGDAVIRTHAVPTRWWLLAHVAHCAVPCTLHAAPEAPTPFAHAHSFVSQTRSLCVVGACFWYCAPSHVVSAVHSRSEEMVGRTLVN
jgi:hypothetical protein